MTNRDFTLIVFLNVGLCLVSILHTYAESNRIAETLSEFIAHAECDPRGSR